jgi:L-rhamnose isomerase
MWESIIHIPTYNNSNKIKSIVVVFIPCQLTLSRIVKRCRDHVRLLHDLLNSMTLDWEIVASSVFSVTEIIAIEYHKLNCIFLHVGFWSQSLLKLTSDQTGSDNN